MKCLRHEIKPADLTSFFACLSYVINYITEEAIPTLNIEMTSVVPVQSQCTLRGSQAPCHSHQDSHLLNIK